jgi:hypothetical protein
VTHPLPPFTTFLASLLSFRRPSSPSLSSTLSVVHHPPHNSTSYTSYLTLHLQAVIVMSTTTSTYRRRFGRAPSPPTWLWYEQIPYDEDSSCSDDDISDCSDDYRDRSCSEDDEEYHHSHSHGHETLSVAAPPAPASESGSNTDSAESRPGLSARNAQSSVVGSVFDEKSGEGHGVGGDSDACIKKDLKGKQRAVEPPEAAEESPRRRERERRRKREPAITLRPILTIQKSQGFVWNQVHR